MSNKTNNSMILNKLLKMIKIIMIITTIMELTPEEVLPKIL